MLMAIIGESCTGKSTLAEKVNEDLKAEIVSGKDYLRLAKSESEATTLFITRMNNAINGEEKIIFVITEKAHFEMVPEQALKVLAVQDIEVIKERFAKRMRGNLPAPIAQMIERKHGMFDDIDYDLKVTIDESTISDVCLQIKAMI